MAVGSVLDLAQPTLQHAANCPVLAIVNCCVCFCSLLQEYLLLHQAAAAKVAASSAAGDSDDSDEEDGRPSAAAAAVAAAASVAAGRKAVARSQGGGYGGGRAQAPLPAAGDEGPATSAMSGGGAAGGYQAADAKKRRKQLLAELRSAVPKPAASLLAEAVLDALAGAAGHAEGIATEPSAARAAAAPTLVAERALAAAMGHLCSLWPQLTPLLLAAAVRQLAALVQQALGEATAGSSSVSGPADPAAAAPAAAAALAWMRRLLPSAQGAAQQQQQQAGSSTGAGNVLAVAGPWKPSGKLLRQLLAAVLPVQAAIAQHAVLQPLRQASCGGAGDASSGGSSAGELAEVLQQACTLLAAAAKAVPGAAAEAEALSRSMTLPSQSGAQIAEAPSAQSAAQLASAAQRQQALLQQLAEAPGLPGPASKRPSAGQQQAAGAEGAAERKRWRRADSWRPCAIGMVPSPADPNGELPHLDAAAQLSLPASFLAVQQKQAAAAAAAAGRVGGKRQDMGLVQAERAQLAAAAEAAEVNVAWPAADRFSRAVGDAVNEGMEEALPIAPPALLPASPAAFLL